MREWTKTYLSCTDFSYVSQLTSFTPFVRRFCPFEFLKWIRWQAVWFAQTTARTTDLLSFLPGP